MNDFENKVRRVLDDKIKELMSGSILRVDNIRLTTALELIDYIRANDKFKLTRTENSATGEFSYKIEVDGKRIGYFTGRSIFKPIDFKMYFEFERSEVVFEDD